FGADIIAGFPTETEAMFENSLKIVDECGLTHLHVFPYSAREGTPAARMPQVNRAVIKERAARLRAVGDRAYRAHLDRLAGTTQRILIEREGLGRTEGFTLAALDAGTPGEIIEAVITHHDGEPMFARPAAARAARDEATQGAWIHQENVLLRQEGGSARHASPGCGAAAGRGDAGSAGGAGCPG